MEIGPWGDSTPTPEPASRADEMHRRWETPGPHCAICAGPGHGDVQIHHLTHGVSVHLCGHHRSDNFQLQGSGEDYTHALRCAWVAAGCLTKQRELALEAHVRMIHNFAVTDRKRPGSYTWPKLREEAERRWSEGQNRLKVVHDLRRLHAGTLAVVPSVRTMRRWHCEGRWLDPPPRDEPPGLGERTLAAIAEFNRDARQTFGSTPFPGFPEEDRWGRPYRRR